MYLISRSPSLTLPIRAGKTDYASNGAPIAVHRALSVQFQKSGGAPDWAKDAVQALPGFGNGLGHEEDPFMRVGVLDTDDEAKYQGWTPEEKAFVEAALVNAGSNGTEYVICSPPKTAKPWDKYDEFTDDDAVEKILYTVDLIGVDPQSVLRYERENAARTEVIEALEALVEQENEDVVGVISL